MYGTAIPSPSLPAVPARAWRRLGDLAGLRRLRAPIVRRERGRVLIDPWLGFSPWAGEGPSPEQVSNEITRLSRDSAATALRVSIGQRAEAWPAAEALRPVTRAAVEALGAAAVAIIEVSTGSPRIARDAALLGQLDRRHAVTVAVRLALGEHCAEMLGAVAALAAEGIAVRVEVVLAAARPGRVSRPGLLELLLASRHAGAIDASARWSAGEDGSSEESLAFAAARLAAGF